MHRYRTFRTLQLNMREGSTGAEILSAAFKLLLAVTWFADTYSRTSVLYIVMGVSTFFPVALLVVGLIHIAAWVQPATLPWVGVRKACCVVGLTIWVSFTYDLFHRGASALALIIVLMILMLVVAIARRNYTVI